MNAGILNKRIVIQQKSKAGTRGASGEELPLWTDLANVWAAAEPLRGQEYLEAMRLQADLDIRFRIRYHEGVRPAMRVFFDGRYFNIVSVIHVKESQREMQLMCKELIEEGV